jgi:hypothetical protein
MALLPVFFLVGIGGVFYQGAMGIESPERSQNVEVVWE